MNGLVEDVHGELIEHGVPDDGRSARVDNVFWSHFCQNLAPSGWVLGAIIAGLGLDVRAGVIAIVAGNVLGALPVGLLAMIGPKTGLTQIEIARFSFGRFGLRLPAWLNWLGAVGWDAVNNVPSTLALIALVALAGIALPFWAALMAVAAIQLAAAMVGHHLVQIVGKYLGWVLLVVFVITGALAIAKGGSLATPHTAVSVPVFVLGLSLATGFAIGFAPYSSDYTRYLPRATTPQPIFWCAFLGLVLSGVFTEVCGLLTATKLGDLSPAGVVGGISALTGAFAPVALLALALSSIAINSYNDNTAAYSLVSGGVRLPRHIAALLTATCGYALAVAGAGTFAELFANYLVVMLYWIAPFAGIVIADWYLFGGRGAPRRRWAPGATIFAGVTLVTIGLFSATPVYTGPVAHLLGNTDIGFFVGFVAAAGLYVLVERREPRIVRDPLPQPLRTSAPM